MTPRRRPPYSLERRLSWLFALQVLLGLGVVGVLIYAVAALALHDRAQARLEGKAELVRHLVAETSARADWPTLRHRLDEYVAANDDLSVTLFEPSGQLWHESAAGEGRAEPSTRLRANVALDGAVQAGGPASARIVLDRSLDAQLLQGLAWALLGATLLGAAAVSLAGSWLVRSSLAPLHDLARQTASLDAGQVGMRLVATRDVRELEPWVCQVNGLLARLELAYRELESFNADVAHELRTPLAALIGHTEVALARERSVEALRDTLGANLEELRMLSALVNDMLFLSRADRGRQAFSRAPTSLAAQARLVLEFYEAPMAERGLGARLSGDAWAPADAGLLRRALSNLLSNAIRHARPGTAIELHIGAAVGPQPAAAGEVGIAVSDEGDEIPEAALPRIFERFFRLESSRAHSGEQHGQGLAIVAAIARMHGGRTFAQSAQGRTTVGFTVAAEASQRPKASPGI